MTGFIVFAALIILAAALFFLGRILLRRRDKYISGMNSFLERCRRFDGVVLDVNDVPVDKEGNTVRAVILQFRDDKLKRTIVHRYTGSSGRKYERGSKVAVYYCEETDSACIKDDNPFYRKARKCSALCFLCRFAASAAILFGVVYLIV